MKRSDLGEFVTSYAGADRRKRVESDRFRRFNYDALVKRDKLNLDIFWLKDDSGRRSGPIARRPTKIAAEIVESLKRRSIASARPAASLAPSNGEAAE